MTIQEAARLGAETLKQVPDPRIDAELLLCSVTGMERFELSLNPARELTDAQELRYRAALRQRAERKPLQYILGTQDFYGCELRVDENVLIPRPETESLCEQALRCMEGIRNSRVADVCTGSGAIAIAIKKNRSDAQVWATERSEDALRVAKENAERNAAEIAFLQGDLLKPLNGMTFDIILSNPPYVKTADLDALQPEVRREPRMALDGGEDGLTFYRRFATEAPEYLKPNGRILLELGDGQAEAVSDIFAASRRFDGVRIHTDLFGKQRVLEAQHCFP
ncbi:MAG: peptide chain release factor N(5)-glutamine methyltransferase [Clostridiales bacterium]|nr:peptide chain release factor N(5)-glutamine methyltransferase [Clostridiales bacterium]